MKAQEKYDECLALLAEMHDISHMMIEAGMDGDLDAISLLEETLKVIKSIDSGAMKSASQSVNELPKNKKLLH